MSLIPNVIVVPKPTAQAFTDPSAGASGDASSPFAALLGFVGPAADPAFAEPGQPLDTGFKDADVPQTADNAALSNLAASALGDGDAELADQPNMPGDQTAALIKSSVDSLGDPTADVGHGDVTDALLSDTADVTGNESPFTATTDELAEPASAAEHTQQIDQDANAEIGAARNVREAASTITIGAADPASALPTEEPANGVAPSGATRPGEPDLNLATQAAHSPQERPPVAAPRQAQSARLDPLAQQGQPYGTVAGGDADGPVMRDTAGAFGRSELAQRLESGQLDARQQAAQAAHNSAGGESLARQVNAIRPEQIGQLLAKAGHQSIDTPDLVAHLPGTADGTQVRNQLPLPSVKVTLPPQQSPAQGIAVQIAHAAQGGIKRFEIRLDPPELGRIEVRLEVAQDGRSSAHLLVERTETLDLLQRDARALERALQNAGLDTSDGGLRFSHKDQGLAEQSLQQGDPSNTPQTGDETNNEDDDVLPTGAGRWYRAANGGLDIRV